MAGMTVAHALVAAVVIDQVVNAAEGDDTAGFDDARRLLGMMMVASKDARDAVFQTPGFREAVRQAKLALCRRLYGWSTHDVRVGLLTCDYGKNWDKVPYSRLDVTVEFFSPKGVSGPVRLWKNAYKARRSPEKLQVGMNYPREYIEKYDRKQLDACREWISACVTVRDMIQCSELTLVMACDEEMCPDDGEFDAWCIFLHDDLQLDCDVTGPELAVTLKLRDGDESADTADETLRRLMEPARWISLVDGTAGHPPTLESLTQRFVLDDLSDDE
jgi:hypothetical protein